MKSSTPLILLASTLIPLAQSAGCAYSSQAGHCCNGSIYRSDPSGDIGDPNTWTCCQGGGQSVTNSQGSCPSGQAVSLADTPTDGSGAQSSGVSSVSVSASASGTSVAVTVSTGAAGRMAVGVPLVAGALVAGGVVLGL